MSFQNVDDSGCRRLWAAVVYQAIKDMEYETGRRRALNWIYSGEDSVGSMRWVCDMLDLDYHKLLRLSMTRAGRRQILRRDNRERVPRTMMRDGELFNGER
jgi:hypothetical protein